MKEGTIELFMSPNYVLDILEEHGLKDAKSLVSPGLTTVTTPDAVSALDGKSSSLYRRGVGKCMWMVPLRSDIYYTTKELARSLQNPTMESMIRLRRLLRYLKGTLHYVMVIYAKVQLPREVPVELKVFVDSDWAGCRTTRKSTSG